MIVLFETILTHGTSFETINIIIHRNYSQKYDTACWIEEKIELLHTTIMESQIQF